MPKKRRKGGVAKSAGSKYTMSLASFRIFVKLYVIAKMLNTQFMQIKQLPPAEYFRGVAKGYEDTFTCMKLKEEEVNAVMRELNPDSVELEAKNIYEKIMEIAKRPKILIGDEATEIKAAKEVFDDYLRRFKRDDDS